MSILFSPITVAGTTFRNRLWVSPMCEYSVDERDGVPTDWHLVHLGAFARGGAGLVMTEATGISPVGRISPQDTGIWNEQQRDAWTPIVRFIHSQGAAAGIQLAHAGRKGSTWRPWSEHHGTVPPEQGGWRTLGPSAVPFEGYDTPEALSTAGIAEVVAQFAAGARRAVDAGFDVLEVHAAHGYLLHEFFSPLSNLRTDEYGGSLENRARILIETVHAVRAEVGDDVPLFVRFSGTDWVDGGWTREETATVSAWAHEAGADLFDISSGGVVAHASIPVGPGYQVPLADFVRHEAKVPVSAVGLITEAQQAEQILADGQADAVMVGREIMRDPHFPLRAAHELGVELDYWPAQYLRARWS